MPASVAELPASTSTASHSHRLAAVALATLLVAGCAVHRPAPDRGAGTVIAPPAPSTDGAQAFVVHATAMLGQPYRYGGAAPGGFDCSGLVGYAARETGLLLPRTTTDLLAVGTEVPRPAVRAGDLVFMRLAAKELHVGIAVDEHRFVHAPSSGGLVRIDQLASEPYAHGWFATRRLDFRSAPR